MTYCAEAFVIFLSVFLIVAIKLFDRNPPPILNVYQRPNGFFWIKAVFMYIIITLRQLKHRIKTLRGQSEDFASLDTYQKFSRHEKAIDAVYFNAANRKGDHFVVGTARRRNKLVDGFFYFILNGSGWGLLESPKLPGTALYQTEEKEEYGAEGIKVEPVIPMKKWKFLYDGKMKENKNPNSVVDVKIEAEWISNLPYFNFDTQIDPWAMACALAREKWSREYFKSLKELHQNHYEQYGVLKGTATINGVSHAFEMDAVRDHSFGLKRDWRNFHRYALHFASSENGDRFHIGFISLPINFSCMLIGYVYSAHDNKIYSISSSDFQMYQHGEDGTAPVDYAFSFIAGGRTYTMQVNVVHSPHFYISKDWEVKVVERLCTFTVNGNKGWGAAEWAYRNTCGKSVPDYLAVE